MMKTTMTTAPAIAPQILRLWLTAILALFLTACGGGGGGSDSAGGTPVVVQLQSIAVTPATPSLAKGVAVQLTAIGTYSDGTSKDISSKVSWSGSPSTLMNISGLVTGAQVGTSQVSAALDGVVGVATVTVTPAILLSVAISPLPTLYKGQTHAMSASGTFSDGTTQDISNTASWSSSVPAVAGINASGTLTGLSVGNTIVMATLNGVSGNTTVTVSTAALQSIALTPTAPAIAVGQTQQMAAMGTYADGTTQTLTGVTWTSSNTAVASVNAAGLVTAVSTGNATITVALNGVSANTMFTVKAATLQSITVTPASLSIAKGQTQPLTATGTYSDGSSQVLAGVTWASGNTAVATVNSAGLVTGVTVGTATITATFNGVSASAVLTVRAATLQSIAVTPAAPSIVTGQTQLLTATGTYSDGASRVLTGVAWTSGNTTVATVSSAGLVTGVTEGAATITATLSGVSASTVMTVKAATLLSIAVTPASPNIAKGQTQQLTAAGIYSDGSSRVLQGVAAVAWTSGNTAVATINSSGLVTGVLEGAATITATFNGVSASTVLTVRAATLQSIVVTPASPAIVKGLTQQLSATGIYSDGSSQILTGATWISGNTAVATVNSSGLATAVLVGNATITGTWNGMSASTVLTVKAATLQSIVVTSTSSSVVKGQTQQLTATGAYSDGSSQVLTGVAWTSGNTAVATVNSSGLVTGVSAGNATITGTWNGMSASTMLTVKAATLKSIAVTSTSSSIVKGQTQQLTATGAYSDGSSQILTGVAWTSGNTAVATVNSSGLVTGASAGNVTITGTWNGMSASTVLTVKAATLQLITVTPASPSIAKGQQTQQLTATGTYSDGSSQILTGVAWASGNTAVATVNSSGLVTGISAGTAVVYATLDGVARSATVTVFPRLVSITVSTVPKLVVGQIISISAIGKFSDGTTADISGAVAWSIDDTSIVTITPTPNSGLLTAARGGSTTVNAVLNGISGKQPIQVDYANLTGVSVGPDGSLSPGSTGMSMMPGETASLAVGGVYSNGVILALNTADAIIWRSEDTTIATVDSAGHVKGIGLGEVAITAYWPYMNITGTTYVRVASTIFKSFQFQTPVLNSIAVNDTFQMSAIGLFADGSEFVLKGAFQSADGNVVTIDPTTGIIRGKSVGNGWVEAVYAFKNGQQIFESTTTIPITVISK